MTPTEMAQPAIVIAMMDHHMIFCPFTWCPSLRKKVRNENLTHHKPHTLRNVTANKVFSDFEKSSGSYAGGSTPPKAAG